MRVVAFIRGINVGGKHKLPMADLRAALTSAGFEVVSTYIQSGNILLTHKGGIGELEVAVEELIESKFGFRPSIIARTKTELEDILKAAPFGDDGDHSHQFVTFFRDEVQGELPADAPNGSCRYLGKRKREIYSQWFKVGDKYEVPSPPKNLQIGTMRNMRVLRAISERL